MEPFQDEQYEMVQSHCSQRLVRGKDRSLEATLGRNHMAHMGQIQVDHIQDDHTMVAELMTLVVSQDDTLPENEE